MRALDKEPAMRWKSVAEFVDALAGAAGRPGIGEVRRAGASRDQLAAPERACSRSTNLAPLLGRGRLGSLVYVGNHRALGVQVAIRVLKRDEQPNWDVVRARFLLGGANAAGLASQPAAGPRLSPKTIAPCMWSPT